MKGIYCASVPCWNCDAPLTIWWDRSQPMKFLPENPLRTDYFRESVKEALDSTGGTYPKLAHAASRFTAHSGVRYDAFHCPHCEMVQGDIFLDRQVKELAAAGQVQLLPALQAPRYPHYKTWVIRRNLMGISTHSELNRKTGQIRRISAVGLMLSPGFLSESELLNG